MTGGSDALWSLSARSVVALLRKSEISPLEVLKSVQARVEEVDPHVNALPTRAFDHARAVAQNVDTTTCLAGLPVAIKDSIQTAGIRTTYGSPVFKEYIPDRSDEIVRTISRNGGIVYAKSNTPEFEAGANTFNKVFGTTRNPWDTTMSAGGSSGGAAVAVATGMAWLAQGTDFACSLRNPAAFCGVVGLRPSIGLVSQGPNAAPFQTLSVAGPIARNVADCGLFLDAMAGASRVDPFARQNLPSGLYERAASAPERPRRLAFSLDLGITPVDPRVAEVFGRSIAEFTQDGIDLIKAELDMSRAHSAFRTLRALQFATAWGHLLSDHRDLLKKDVVWNIEEGLSLDATQIVAAEHDRAQIRNQLLDLLEQCGFLVLPTSIVPPYPSSQTYVGSCNGVTFDNYLEWMAIAYAISLTGFPAISIPAGQTPDGLPVGLQIVGSPGHEVGLLSIAAYAEEMLGHQMRKPITPTTGLPITDTDASRKNKP